jgi:hypothetical protein
MRNQAEFENALDRWVSERLTRRTGWNDLVSSLPSVCPDLVLESVNRLSLLHLVHFPTAESSEVVTSSFAMELWASGKIATPHPLDSTWWFGDSALETLLECIEGFSAAGSSVLLLGTPTLFHYAIERVRERSFFLLDREPATPRGLPGHTFVDLLRNQPSVAKADVIILDPPWYPLETRAFLLTASRNARRGSKVLLSVPPIGTRPSVEQERQELLGWARPLGLRLLDYETGVLPYLSPLFERNALRSAGIRHYPEEWRRGDLATFECDGTSQHADLRAPMPREEEWNEVVFGLVRIRIRTAPAVDWETVDFREIVPGGVLPSVSRRDKRLQCVGAWTSGNRVFHCNAPYVLTIVAESLAARRCAVSSVASRLGANLTIGQKREVERVASVLADVVAIEEKEIADWRNERNENMVELPSHESRETPSFS